MITKKKMKTSENINIQINQLKLKMNKVKDTLIMNQVKGKNKLKRLYQHLIPLLEGNFQIKSHHQARKALNS